MRRGLWMLGTIGSLAPFIGLFGTVWGIMKSFHDMAMQGSGGFAVVAAGISEALVATAVGLLVAILALAVYNYLQVTVGRDHRRLRALLRAPRPGAALRRVARPPRYGRREAGGGAPWPSTPCLAEIEAGDDIVAEINITPLTDIFLVLLIIFMVTTSRDLESGQGSGPAELGGRRSRHRPVSTSR